MTPSEKRLDERAATISSSDALDARRPRRTRPRRPGLGPADARTATARLLTLRTRPQFEQVSISAERPERAHRADHRQLVMAALAALRPGRVDQRRRAGSGAGRPGRSAGRPRRSRRRAGPPRSGPCTRGLRSQVDHGAEDQEGQERGDQAEHDDDRQPADDAGPSPGSRTGDVTWRIWLQIGFRTSTRFTAASYQPLRPWATASDCPAWSSRRGPGASRRGPTHPRRRSAAVRRRRPRAAVRRGLGLPTDGDAAGRSQAARAARPSRPFGRRASGRCT